MHPAVSTHERRRSIRYAFDGPPIQVVLKEGGGFLLHGVFGDISLHGCKVIGSRAAGDCPERGEILTIEFTFNSRPYEYQGRVRRINNSLGCLILGIEFKEALASELVAEMFSDNIGKVVCLSLSDLHFSVEGALNESVVKPISWLARKYGNRATLDLSKVRKWDACGVFVIAMAHQNRINVINPPF